MVCDKAKKGSAVSKLAPAWQVSPSHSAPKSAEVSWYVAFGIVHGEFPIDLKMHPGKLTF